MNDFKPYEWCDGVDHAWLSCDKIGNVAYISCSVDVALPKNSVVDRRLIAGLDARLESYFGQLMQCLKRQSFPSSVSSLGFFVYDARRDQCGKCIFELVSCPETPVSIGALPISLRRLAETFCLKVPCFGETNSQLSPAVFSDCSVGANSLTIFPLKIDRIESPSIQLRQISSSRAYLELSATRGFQDMKENGIASVFCWNDYVSFFCELLKELSSLRNVGASIVKVRSFPGVANVNDLTVTNSDFLIARICVEDSRGNPVLRIERENVIVCSSYPEVQKFSIECNEAYWDGLKDVFVSAARKVCVGLTVKAARKQGWMIGVRAKWLLRILGIALLACLIYRIL